MLGTSNSQQVQPDGRGTSSNIGFLSPSVGGQIHLLGGGASDFSISVSPTSLSVKQGKVGNASVSATGGYSQTVSLSASGQPSGVQITFSPQSGTPSFSSTMQIAVGYENNVGNYTISVKGTGADGKERAVQFYFTVLQAGQAQFVVENLMIAPQEIKEGETVTISIAVVNVGEMAGTYVATLLINGSAVENKSVTLAAGGSGQIAFTFVGTAPGTYTVSLGGKTGTFTVKPGITPPPENVESESIVAENLIIKENEPVTLAVENVNIFMMRIQSTREVRSTKVIVQQLTAKPAEEFSPTGVAYSYLIIIAENVQEGDLREVTIFFQLQRSWTLEHGFGEDEIALHRYNFSTQRWGALETQKAGENDGRLYFSASSPGLSLYAIVGTKREVPLPQPGVEEGKGVSPYVWAGLGVVVAVLVVSPLVFWRKRSRGDETLRAPSKEKPAKGEKWEF